VFLENIKKSPQHIKIFGNCEIKKSSKLKKIPYDFIITGNVEFYRCSSLKMNADHNKGLFYIHGKLIAQKCNSFNFINFEKKVLKVQGQIIIKNCNSFSYLLAGISNNVNIINCKNFKELLAGNYYNLKIECCNNFNTIHPNVVTENLILNNNKKFTSFSDNLTVKNLHVILCPIKSFVSKITILENLLFKSCDSLQNIDSDNVQLNGDIIINNCQQLIINIIDLGYWPQWICSPKIDGSLRSMQILGDYKEVYLPSRVNLISPDIEKIVNSSKDSSTTKFLFDIFSLIEFFATLGNCRNQITYPYIIQYLPMLKQAHLVDYLNKVRLTNDFLYANKQLLGKQIVNILSLFQDGVDENISQMAIDLVEYSVSSCVDKTSLVTDTLDMLTKQKKAIESGDVNELRNVAKHNIIIGMSDAIAMQHNGDKIENILKARLKVRKDFNLSKVVQTIAYGHLSNFDFNKQDLEKIKESSLSLSLLKKKLTNLLHLEN
jgi:hypothetical protein